MSSLSKLKQRLNDSSDASDALSELVQYTSMVVTGTALGGGVLTIPIILYSSSKAASAVLKLLNLLMPLKSEEYQSINNAERIDDIFYLIAQRSYLSALKIIENQFSKIQTLNKKKHDELIKKIELNVIKPDHAEARFEFGWTVESGPIQLFESYNAWLHPLLISFEIDEEKSSKWIKKIEVTARKNLFKELVSKRRNKWLVDYQLLSNNAQIIDLLKGFINPNSEPKENAWKNYLNDLKEKPSNPIWGEEEHGLGISKLFVEPDYEYARKLDSGSVNLNPTATLQNFLSGLLTQRRPSTELIFLMGGPGIGKTSFMDVFCSNLAGTNKLPVILVPAKRLDPNKPIFSEVQSYLKSIGHSALSDLLGSTQDCIVAIDGFDELAHATLSTLDSFFRNANDLVRDRKGLRLKIVLSGRPTLFSSNDVSIPSGSHVIKLKSFDKYRVQLWSNNWKKAKNSSFDGVSYLNSKSKDIRELAAQPMLLYLLAKMFDDNEPIPIDMDEEKSSKYNIYVKILDWICRRQEEKHLTHVTSNHLRRFLQIAGLATHQSGKRILHWYQFSEILKRSGLADNPKDIDSKSYSTILSFAFTSVQERAWEFTHKSFGEALAAEAIGRVLEDISESGRYGEKWRLSSQQTTSIWVETFGPYFLTKDILDFYQGWLRSKEQEFLRNLIERLIELYKCILGPIASSFLSNVSHNLKRPVLFVIGNSVRSWFAILNQALDFFIKFSGDDGIINWKDLISIDEFRNGVYLSNIVSPISMGESKTLFESISLLVGGKKNDHSSTLKQNIKYLRKVNLENFEDFNQSNRRYIHHFKHKYASDIFKVNINDIEYYRYDNDTIIINTPYPNEVESFISKSPIEIAFEILEDAISRGYEPSAFDIIKKQKEQDNHNDMKEIIFSESELNKESTP